ncbi:MAG: MalY/PatB family protein [Pseudomonadota bacterium]|nr:MalY/PatB family protein [Pseudomonadota bacterium]MEE3101591.1 MalY/PatB family protein [Pseudomonadota bacterium]
MPTDFDFDARIDRRGTHSSKWDKMEALYGVSPVDGIPMWVADMDFAAPPAVQAALRKAVELNVHGYYGDDSDYRAAVANWMKTRHGWEIDTDWLSTTHGLVAGLSHCIRAYTAPGDGIILFTPVYHAFHKIIAANGRRIVQSVMPMVEGRYRMDLDALAASLDGSEKMVVFCSPHNPGGMVWSVEEIRALAQFCEAHDLILVSDEVHHDLVLPGGPKHAVAMVAAPEQADRMVIMAAASKTFNLAGGMTGGVFIPNPELRAKFAAKHATAGASPNSMGMLMSTAAYAEGAEWLDSLLVYLDGNRRLFHDAVQAIPGLSSIWPEATYMSLVDFAGTGMEPAEFQARVEKTARIAANHGDGFGRGGETTMRFNFALPRALVREATERLAGAFGDLQ